MEPREAVNSFTPVPNLLQFFFTRKASGKIYSAGSFPFYGPLAQRIRAPDYGSGGHRFKSYRAHFSFFLTSLARGFIFMSNLLIFREIE